MTALTIQAATANADGMQTQAIQAYDHAKSTAAGVAAEGRKQVDRLTGKDA